MLWVLEWHDVAGVKMYTNIRVVETIHKLDHIRRAHQVGIEKDIFDIKVNS